MSDHWECQAPLHDSIDNSEKEIDEREDVVDDVINAGIFTLGGISMAFIARDLGYSCDWTWTSGILFTTITAATSYLACQYSRRLVQKEEAKNLRGPSAEKANVFDLGRHLHRTYIAPILSLGTAASMIYMNRIDVLR